MITDESKMTINELWEEIELRLNLLEIIGGRCYPKRSATEVRYVIFQVRDFLARIDQLLLELERRLPATAGGGCAKWD